MKTCHKLSAFSFILLNMSFAAAQSNENDGTWYDVSGKAYLGYGYDSNVSVSELDTNTDTSDTATYSRAQLKVKLRPNKRWTFAGSAQYANTKYKEQSAFDLAITTYSGEMSYQAPWVKIGMHHYHANADLDSIRYLTYKQSGVSAGNGFLERAYWRVSADSIDKELPADTRRNSDAEALRGDVFWFFNQASFIKFGASYHDEDALDTQFDFAGKKVDVSYALTFPLLDKMSEITVAYEYEQRAYENEGPGGVGREDDRQRIKANFTYPLYDFADISLNTQYGNYNSTVVSADYKETVAELGVRLHF